jgi:hypothetical protein
MMNKTLLITVLAGMIPLSTNAICSEGTGEWSDPSGDATIRRTDVGNDAPLPIDFEPIDLLHVSIRGWQTPTPTSDPYNGTIVGGDADLLRLQVVIDGLVVPPGPLAIDGSTYNPYLFGERPLFGFIELDVDGQKNSGGELMPLANQRYLANVGRFGMSPLGSISERIIRDAGDLDSNFFTLPEFERTGGEFTLALCGCLTPTIESQDGDMDSVFDEGETWIVRSRFFERFQALAPESGMFGGSSAGLFDPFVDLQFAHSMSENTTTVTLVFPITNTGAAQLAGAPTQSMDFSVFNHTSIEEALDDLIGAADFTSGALEELTDPWRGRDYNDYARPASWGAHALIGTAPTAAQPSSFYVWTDTGFYETLGDLNDDDLADDADALLITNAVASDDGGPSDDDGLVNGEIAIIDFGRSFDIRDLDGNGIISGADASLISCAADLLPDGILDVFDVFAFLDLFNASDPAADFEADGVLDVFDVFAFLNLFNQGCN